MAKRQIGTPRFYCDVLSYLKSIGKYNGVRSSGFQQNPVENKEKVFTMNPYQPYDYQLGSSHHWAWLSFFSNQEPLSEDEMVYSPEYELGKLLAYHNNSDDDHHTSGWYAGVLGHNFASAGVTGLYQTSYGKGDDGTIYKGAPDKVKNITNYDTEDFNCIDVSNAGKPKHDGFSLWEVTDKSTERIQSAYNTIKFGLEKSEGDNFLPWGEENFAKIGAYTTGIFIEAPNSPDLSVKKTLEMSGISANETIAGNTLVNIKHKGVPNWGDQPAWTLQKTDGRDYTNVANRARRIWDMSFSYISDDNLFDAAQNSNSFFNDEFDEFDDEKTYSVDNFDTSMSSFFKLTQNGALPFIFCPDSKATRTVDGVEVDNLEFAICMLDQDSISCTQVAHRTWNVSLAIREVY